MKKNLLKLTFGLSFLALTQTANAQCPEISCIPDATLTTDSAMCDVIVNYPTPTYVDTCITPTSQTFSYTGAQQTFVVPAGVTSISVDAYGAQGGSNSPSTNINYGGRVQADLPVTPGTTIYVYVGEQPTGLTGGWNGGGNGESGGIGGGGASDLRIGGTTLNDRVIVAGAGGGGGFWSGQEVHGGLGGDSIAGPGYRGTISNPGGDPGTQTASGNGTCVSFNNPAVAGGFGYGGAPSSCGCEGYGGGAGWYGGGGSGNCRGGGGGSSYTDPSTSNVVHAQGVRAGHGEITLSWIGAGGTSSLTQIAGLPSGSAFPVGTTTNTFVAESNGGLDTCSFDVIVLDNQLPTISCPTDITICEGETVTTTAPATTDNCTGETVTYITTGATTTSGNDFLNGVTFNPGTTTVWYIVTDVAGNQDSCSFDVIVNPAPSVSLAAFSVDSLCDYDPAIALPAGTPASGTYTGAGVNGTDFDPSQATQGVNWVTYTYTDSMGCVGADSASIYVDGCAGFDNEFHSSEVSVYPNPSSGQFTVSFGANIESVNYSVNSVDGKTILAGNAAMDKDLTIDLSAEPNGIYLLRLDGLTSTKTITLIKD